MSLGSRDPNLSFSEGLEIMSALNIPVLIIYLFFSVKQWEDDNERFKQIVIILQI